MLNKHQHCYNVFIFGKKWTDLFAATGRTSTLERGPMRILLSTTCLLRWKIRWLQISSFKSNTDYVLSMGFKVFFSYFQAALKRMENRDGGRSIERESPPSTSYALSNASLPSASSALPYAPQPSAPSSLPYAAQPSASYGPPSLPPPSYTWATATPVDASPPQASAAWTAPPPTAPPLSSVPPPQPPPQAPPTGWIEPPPITMYNFGKWLMDCKNISIFKSLLYHI